MSSSDDVSAARHTPEHCQKTFAAQLGRLGVRHMAHVVIMAHGTRLLTAALDADEYLIVQIKSAIGRLNLLESQIATTEVAV